MKARAYLFFLLSIFFIFGCAGSSKKEDGLLKNSSLLEPSGIFKFSDVPIPIGFKPLPQSSYSFESSGVRVGLLKYQGKVNPDRIVNFYKEQMPMYNWMLLNVVEYGQRLMNFERETETCIISMDPKGSSTILTISLGPKAQILPKKPKQPVK
ncbi:MAG: hypothetical protein AABY28_03725 [Candidatus Omnitrophota bacterium]